MNMALTSPLSAVERISFDEIEHPLVRYGVDYWRRLRGERSFPSRDQIKPRDLAPVLSMTSLFKVLDDGDFEYRIVGDAIVRAYEINLQNRRLSDVETELPSFREFVRPVLVHVAKRRIPIALRGKIGHDAPGTNFTHHENAILPLGAGDDVVDHIITFSNYERRAF
jgi:hypothetical protein